MSAALRYFADRAIDPNLAVACGVRWNAEELLYPTGKRRALGEKRFMQPTGKPLGVWWVSRNDSENVLVCEGESDALAALSALDGVPPVTGLGDLSIAAVPGTGFPVARLAEALAGYRTAFLAFDADRAGSSCALRVATACAQREVRPVVVTLPDDDDLGSWLVRQEDRGDALANLLVDHESAAPERQAYMPHKPPAPKVSPVVRRANGDFEREREELLMVAARAYVEKLTGEELGERGKDVRCPHPDHEDRRASCHLYEGGWRCFACGESGTIYEFAAHRWGLGTRGSDFRELHTRLCALFGIQQDRRELAA